MQSFGLEPAIYNRYFDSLSVSMKEGEKKSHLGGLASGATFFVMFGGYALVFWYGGTLVGKGEISFDQVRQRFCDLIVRIWSLEMGYVEATMR